MAAGAGRSGRHAAPLLPTPDDERSSHGLQHLSGAAARPVLDHRPRHAEQPAVDGAGLPPGEPWHDAGPSSDEPYRNGYNGHSPNGYAANGHSPNGYAANGHSPNGYAANGYAAGPVVSRSLPVMTPARAALLQGRPGLLRLAPPEHVDFHSLFRGGSAGPIHPAILERAHDMGTRAGGPGQQTDNVGRGVIGDGQLGTTARRGLLWALGSQWVSYLTQVLALIVLARLVPVRDFGVVGMALTFTVFADQFRSMGLSQAVVQRDDLTLRQVNALFWINTAAGFVLAGILALLGPVAVWFYGEPELALIMAILGISYIFSGLAVQPNALLARELDFKVIALRTTSARVLANMSAIVLGILGAGYWALVAQQVVGSILICAFVWIGLRWRPSMPGGFREAMPLLRFGVGVTVAELANALSRNGDYILIGKFLGASPLGYYTRAYNLLMLPVRQLKTPLGGVIQPMLASLRGEPERYRRLYTATISGLSHVGMPLTAGLAVAAHPLIITLFGDQWEPAVGIFQYLALAGVIQMVSSTLGWLLVTADRATEYARFAIAAGAFTVLSFAVGLPWGAEGVAASYAIGQAVILVPAAFYCAQGNAVRPSDIFGAIWRPTVSTTIISLIMIGAIQLLGAAAGTAGTTPPAWLELCVLVVVGSLSWVGVLAVWRRARGEVTEIVSIVRRRRAAPVAPDAAAD